MPLPIPGEASPPFRALASDGRTVDSDDLVGGYTTLCFFGSAGHAAMAEMLAAIAAEAGAFDGVNHRFLGVSIDPADEHENQLAGFGPGMAVLWDFDQSLSRLFGAIGEGSGSEEAADGIAYQPLTVLLDAGQRVISVHRIDDPAKHPALLARFVDSLPAIGPSRLAQPQAPILLIPMVFEVELCRRLIADFDKNGGKPSGVLEDVDDRTVLTIDPARKQRQDAVITDETLRQAAHIRIRRRLIPEVRKVFQFEASRMERSVIARYATGDFCAPHRDNKALGTAHRQIAISIPLNADACAGGLLRFPEYGSQLYPIPTGCALIHSCELMHEVTPVTQGTRYSFIPILFGDNAARRYDANTAHLGPGVSPDRREFVADA